MRISDLVLHNDHQLVALHKPAGMPVQEDSSGDASIHRIAQAYCKRDLYLVNRLDRPCSGVVVMAKTPQAAAHLSAQWKARTVRKTYLAIVPTGISPEEGTLTHTIEKQDRKSIATIVDAADAEANAVLTYRLIRHLDSFDLLEVTAKTGFFHQIRAQLASFGFPIKGDVKYGARRANKDRSINLHCVEINLMHPGSSDPISLRCPLPDHDIWPALNSTDQPTKQ
jgi:23S rRNA pseudouridine1911/1915/1917 synthase